MKLIRWTIIIALFFSTTLTVAQQNSANDGIFAEHSIVSRDIVVELGDTFRKIAKRELGRAGYAQQLAEFNGTVESVPLTPGQIIRIPIHVQARKEFAQVIFVKGPVIVQRSLVKDTTVVENITVGAQHSDFSNVILNTLERNSEVYPGDVIDTGDSGFASIEFSTGSVINLQPNTETEINRLNCLPKDDSCVIDIKVRRGKVTSNVQTRKDQPTDFRISTPYASAAVRGTVFDIEAASDNLVVGVTEGAVDFSSNSSSDKLALDTGFGSFIKPGQTPNDPIALLPSPVFKRIPARMAPGDTISWWPNTQTDKYGALVSKDAAGRNNMAITQVTGQEIGFDSLDIGEYFLTVRAIDENGIRGFKSSSRITIAEIDPQLDTVDTKVSTEGSEYLVEISQPAKLAKGYEIQISKTKAFDDPISVDIDPSGTAVFRIHEDTVFTRARVLMDPFTVSEFGPTTQSTR